MRNAEARGSGAGWQEALAVGKSGKKVDNDGKGSRAGSNSQRGDDQGPLINLEEPGVTRDLYCAVATPDGRQALLKRPAGEHHIVEGLHCTSLHCIVHRNL